MVVPQTVTGRYFPHGPRGLWACVCQERSLCSTVLLLFARWEAGWFSFSAYAVGQVYHIWVVPVSLCPHANVGLFWRPDFRRRVPVVVSTSCRDTGLWSRLLLVCFFFCFFVLRWHDAAISFQRAIAFYFPLSCTFRDVCQCLSQLFWKSRWLHCIICCRLCLG